MWISKNIAGMGYESLAERGSVTLSSNEFEAGSTCTQRSIDTFAPYGYQSKAPVGQQVMILPSSDGQAVIGSLCSYKDLDSGEIRIISKGGATILLKNDGTIQLNSLTISKEGVVTNNI